MLKYFLVILIALPGWSFARDIPGDNPCVPVITITESENNICAGTAVTFHAVVADHGTNGVYKWKKNNLDAGANNSPDYTFAGFHTGDVVTCEYTCHTLCNADTTVASNQVLMQVVNEATPLITISNNDSLICEGEITTFTSTSFYGNEIPSYLWTVNDIPVGTNSPLFTTNSITNGAKVKCELTISSPSCPGTSRSASSQLTIYVYPLIHPAIEITPSDTNICRGQSVTFTAKANGGAHPALTWMVNGIVTGAEAGSFIAGDLHDGDTISCTVTVEQDSRCHTTTSAASNEIVIHVHDYPDPSVSIAAPVLEACAGKPLLFTATSQNTGANAYYQWQVNGQNATSGGATFIYDKFENGDSVSCNLSTDIPGCPLSLSVSSNVKVVTIRDLPLIAFSPPEVTIMAGGQAQLNALVTGTVASFLWTPAGALQSISLTPTTIPLFRDTLFNLSVIDANGCMASQDLQVKVLHPLYMPSVFTPNNDGINDVFRVPPGSSLLLHEFSVFDGWGHIIFTTKDIARGWDGKYHGKDAGNGVYVYMLKGTFKEKDVFVKGIVTLLR